MYNLGELLEDFHGRHTKYQVDNFIIKLNGKTMYGQYKQILRELNSRVKTLVNIKLELDEINFTIKEKKSRLNVHDGLKQIELNRLIINKKFREKDFDEIFYEFRIFFAQACAIKKELGDINDKKNELESNFWTQNFIEKIAIDIAYMGTISSSNLETLTSMPHADKINILNAISAFPTKAEALSYLAKLEYFEIKYNLEDYILDKANFVETIHDILKISG
jgi:hypothetical protein